MSRAGKTRHIYPAQRPIKLPLLRCSPLRAKLLQVAMDDLVITPFRDIVAQGRSAVENAGDDKSMVKAAQSLIEEGERALNKIDPLCRRYLDEYGFKFVEALKENGKAPLNLLPRLIIKSIWSAIPNRL